MASEDIWPPRDKWVGIWLLVICALVTTMILVGGATRLTESGLSIVEWKPVTGVLPPLSQEAWQAEFAKYQEIPQYRELNRGMSVDEFKTIYWWEWGHRFLGRLIGVAFFVPFLIFWFAGYIPRALLPRLLGLFLLGGLQGALGWYMVKSGLIARVDVSQYRLTAHLGVAVAILGYTLWLVFDLGRESKAATRSAPSAASWVAGAVLALIFLQILAGGLVAGIDAGFGYNTWPLIDGALIPEMSRLWFEQPWWRNLFENTLTVQFNHRMMAYAIVAATLWHAAGVVRAAQAGATVPGALLLLAAVTVQAALGIVTLLYVVPLALALAHQAMAVVTLAVAVIHAEHVSRGARVDVRQQALT